MSVTDFLTDRAVKTLYEKGNNLPSELQYILHTEPSLPRTDRYQIVSQPELKWREKAWIERFSAMILTISKFLGKAPLAIEMHPGDARNNCSDICEAAKFIIDQYNAEFNLKPLVLLENRTNQIVSTGDEICSIWKVLNRDFSSLRDMMGIVLDIQQLFTVTSNKFEKQFNNIPLDSIKGVHIHSRHKSPKLSDTIPWAFVFERLSSISKGLIVNPEVIHRSDVQRTLDFCRNGLKG